MAHDEKIPATLDKLRVALDEIRPRANNPRRGDIDAIADSLDRNGQFKAIVVNKRTGEILAGNHTYAAAKRLGWNHIAATFVDVDEDEAARIVLADNRTSDLGHYDDTALAALLASLPDGDLSGTGYDQDDLDAMLAHDGDGPRSLDDLADQYGEMTEDDFLTPVTLRVDPKVADAWKDHRAGYESDSIALNALLGE